MQNYTMGDNQSRLVTPMLAGRQGYSLEYLGPFA